ncbi:YceD family protein [Roseovarius aquimarinus]|uniref:YceD family protein n=1 Tax=Roseovarius aquimarinus TaxID=1229156 RepID=A0ABW7I3W3_9RHOB
MAKPLTHPAALRVAELPKGTTLSFDIAPDEEMRRAMAEELGVISLRKVTFRGTLAPSGRRDWQLDARLGATAVQECVVTLEPVTSRIDQDIRRRFLSDMPRAAELDPTPEDGVEMPEDDTEEPLGEVIDLARVLIEALALSLPDYPRKEDAEPVELRAAPPGETPLDDDAVKPFAGLAALRAKMGDGGEDDTGQ